MGIIMSRLRRHHGQTNDTPHRNTQNLQAEGLIRSPRGTRDISAGGTEGGRVESPRGFGTPRGSGTPREYGTPGGGGGGGGGGCETRLNAVFRVLRGYRTRALAFAAVGILLNAYGATHGRREWVVRYDGSFYQVAAAKLLKPVVTLSLGFGAPNAVLSGVTCLVLLIGVVFGRPLLCLPSLLLTVCELVGDVSDALVAAGLLLAHLGAVPAALYSAIAVLAIAVELFLWHGVLMFYETAIVERIRYSVNRPAPSSAPSSAPSVARTPSRVPSTQVTTTPTTGLS